MLSDSVNIGLLTVLLVSSSGFLTSLLDLLESVFIYFTFLGVWRGEEKSVLCSCLCSLCLELPLEKCDTFCFCLRLSRLMWRSFSQVGGGLYVSCSCQPSLGSLCWGGLGGQRMWAPLPLPWYVWCFCIPWSPFLMVGL